jgi:uncharacterized membrane protein
MHAILGFTPNWIASSSAFLAALVEFVEAFTIVLVVGITINWRSSLLGTLLATVTLAILIAIFGVTLINVIPLETLRVVVGLILVLFGLKWLKKAILRYSGRKALHDEEAIYEEELAVMKARGVVTTGRLDPFGVVTSFKSVLLEGLEVAFIVIFTPLNVSVIADRNDALLSAVLGATAACLVVVATGILVRAPLSRIPENTLKFIVGIMLTSFGTFWGGEGLGIEWMFKDFALFGFAGFYLLVSFVLIQFLWLPAPKQEITLSVSPGQE